MPEETKRKSSIPLCTLRTGTILVFRKQKPNLGESITLCVPASVGSHTRSLSIEISWEVKCEVGQPQTHPRFSLADRREELGRGWVALGGGVPGWQAPVEIGVESGAGRAGGGVGWGAVPRWAKEVEHGNQGFEKAGGLEEQEWRGRGNHSPSSAETPATTS